MGKEISLSEGSIHSRGNVIFDISCEAEGDLGEGVVIGFVTVYDDIGSAGLGPSERDGVCGTNGKSGAEGQNKVAGLSCGEGTLEVGFV